MIVWILALVIGVVAGLRSMTAPAAVAWAATLGWVDLTGTWLEFLGTGLTPSVLTLVALGELIVDKVPGVPSRTILVAFLVRVASGFVCGAALVASSGPMWLGGIAGLAGAAIGTFGGAAFRARLTHLLGRWPAALIEDAIALATAAAVILAIR
ncbi:MAG TPA: DUF4126 family protein [Steroidobacteraceae bacterium]|nr:DUF4126 family protein [Steroidobacteraceae bacterium]